jgi:hypothetical protein
MEVEFQFVALTTNKRLIEFSAKRQRATFAKRPLYRLGGGQTLGAYHAGFVFSKRRGTSQAVARIKKIDAAF